MNWHDPDANGRRHSLVFEHVTSVEQVQGDLHTNNIEYARLYSNREEPGLTAGLRSRARDADLVTENIIKSVVDTACNLIGKSRPRIRILTDNGDWEVQQLAKDLEKYLWGMFQGKNVHQHLTNIFRDACIWGTGVLAFCIRDEDVCVERALIDEIVVDENEVPHGGLPKQLHRVRLISKNTLKKLYPEQAEAIEEADTSLPNQFGGATYQVDPGMVAFIESWYLGKRYVASVSNATLEDEEYDEDYYPFVFYHWSPPLTGFYGQGLAEELLGFQIRLNELNDFIQRCQDLIATPRVALDAGSQVLKPHLDNEIGAILYYVGQKPVFFTPTAVGSEIYSYKEQLKASAYRLAGISEQASAAVRPEGVEAAAALRELSDNQSQRFSTKQQYFEDAAVQVGEMFLRLAHALYSSGATPPRVFMAEKFVETIEWPKVDLDEQRFTLSVMPASIMSETPAGRLQRVIELAQYGVQLDQRELREMLGYPDIGRANSEADSSFEDIEWTISQLLRGKWQQPETFQDLQLGISRVTAAYLDARRQGAPEHIKDMLRQWIEMAGLLLQKAQPPSPTVPQPVQLPPGAVSPMAPPVPGGLEQMAPAAA